MTWQEQAACRDADDPDLFFVGENNGGGYQARGLRTSAAQHQAAAAKAICARCPVREQCATDAIGDPSRYGIWGGLTRDERAALRERVAS